MPEPGQDERSWAALTHLTQQLAWFIGLPIVFATKRQSRFVAFHALQALLWQFTLMATFYGGMMPPIAVVFGTAHAPPAPHEPPPPMMLVGLAGAGLLMLTGVVTTLAFMVVYGIRANRGEWAASLSWVASRAVCFSFRPRRAERR